MAPTALQKSPPRHPGAKRKCSRRGQGAPLTSSPGLSPQSREGRHPFHKNKKKNLLWASEHRQTTADATSRFSGGVLRNALRQASVEPRSVNFETQRLDFLSAAPSLPQVLRQMKGGRKNRDRDRGEEDTRLRTRGDRPEASVQKSGPEFYLI